MGVVLLCVFVGAGGFVYWLPAAVCAVVSVAGGVSVVPAWCIGCLVVMERKE